MRKDYEEARAELSKKRYRGVKGGMVDMIVRQSITPYKKYIHMKGRKVEIARELRKIDPKLV